MAPTARSLLRHCLQAPGPPPGITAFWARGRGGALCKSLGKSRTWPIPHGALPNSIHMPPPQPWVTGLQTPTQPSGAGTAVSSRAAAPGAGPISRRLPAGSPRLAPGAAPGPEPGPPGPGLWPLRAPSCRGPCSLRTRQRMNQLHPQLPPSTQSPWWNPWQPQPASPLLRISPPRHCPHPLPPNPPLQDTAETPSSPIRFWGRETRAVNDLPDEELLRAATTSPPSGRWTKVSCLEPLMTRSEDGAQPRPACSGDPSWTLLGCQTAPPRMLRVPPPPITRCHQFPWGPAQKELR